MLPTEAGSLHLAEVPSCLPTSTPRLWSLVSILHHRAQGDLEAGTQRLTPGDLLAVMDADERSAVVTVD